MASDLKTLVKAADIMRKASMSDRSMAPVWKPSRKYTGVDQAKRRKDKLKHSLLKLVPLIWPQKGRRRNSYWKYMMWMSRVQLDNWSLYRGVEYREG
jgi:hypothetical protein